jgi:gas vesicle protein
MSVTKVLGALCVALVALLVAASAGAQSKPKLDGAAVKKAIDRHDKTLLDARQYITELTTVGVQICQSEEKEGEDDQGRWTLTNALADRLDVEAGRLKTYRKHLQDLAEEVDKAKLPGDDKDDRKAIKADLDDAAEKLKDAASGHEREFDDAWPRIGKIIRKHLCKSFKNAAKNAEHEAGNAWDDEHAGLFLLDRAVRRSEGRKPPNKQGRGVASGDPYSS